MLRKATVLAVATAIGVSATVAQAADNSAALAPGKPAGVKQAMLEAPLWVWVAGIGFIALTIGIAASSGGSSTTATTSTAP